MSNEELDGLLAEGGGGWTTPDVNFNNVTIQGTLLVNGDDGSHIKIWDNPPTSEIEMLPPTLAGYTFDPARVFTASNGAQVRMVIQTPAVVTPSPIDPVTLSMGIDIGTSTRFFNVFADSVALYSGALNSVFESAFALNIFDKAIQWGIVPAVAVEAPDTSVTNGTTSATAYTNTLAAAGIRGVVFVAPPSGKVSVHGTAGGFNNTVSGFALMDFEVRSGAVIGAGAIFRASDENTAAQFQSNTANAPATLAVDGLVTGLTPGLSYNANLTYRVTNAAHVGSWNRRKIGVRPEL